jgi:MGT family glycosyltransferase
VRFLVTVMPIAGHVAPITGVVAELVSRGHAVSVYTGARYTQRFADLGAKPVVWSAAKDFDEWELASASTDRRAALRLVAMMEQVFLKTGPGQAADLARELDQTPADLVVGDLLSIGARLVSEQRDRPWASVNLLALNAASAELPPPGFPVPPAHGRAGRVRDQALWLAYRAVTGRLQRTYNQVRAELGLPRDPQPYGIGLASPWLLLATGCPLLELPRTDLPETVHFVGRLAPAAGTGFQPAPPRTAGRPRVVVTQGTHNVDPRDLIQPALAALADLDVDVIATSGRRGSTDIGAPVPANAEVVDFLNFSTALPETTVLVTNGGWGGVLEGLAAGVPLVLAGKDIDKPQNASRVARAGAGINLRTGRPKPAALAGAVRKVLGDPSYTDRALRVGAQLAQLGGVRVAADLIERLAENERPVRRTTDPWSGQRT